MGRWPTINRRWNAGLDLTVTDLDGDTLEFVHFDGGGSTDPDGTMVSHNWTENGNTINNAATFTIMMLMLPTQRYSP